VLTAVVIILLFLFISGSFPSPVASGAGTNLKVGAPVRHESPEIFFWLCPSTFFGSKSTISRFGERFCNDRFGQFLVCCSSTHGAPPPRASHLQKWGHVSPCPMESSPLPVAYRFSTVVMSYNKYSFTTYCTLC